LQGLPQAWGTNIIMKKGILTKPNKAVYKQLFEPVYTRIKYKNLRYCESTMQQVFFETSSLNRNIEVWLGGLYQKRWIFRPRCGL
jgi:hypothetical protein